MDARPTILLVEDDPSIAALLRDVLTDAGYRVLVAATPTVGCTILAAFRVGLVLTDGFHDGGDDPWAPLAPLVARAVGSPVILCSAHSPTVYADYADHGFAALLPKPFDLDGLLALVASVLPDGDDAGAATGAGVGAVLPKG
jgi:two-component system nitrogen regulation response regulator GlnG